MKCRFCGKEKSGSSRCVDCGLESYEAGGRILYGKNDGDRGNCMMYITDKYLFVGRLADNHFKKQRLGRGFGFVGMVLAEASSDLPKTYGYYPLEQIRKVIFPFLNSRIDDKEAAKLVMKNGKDVILIFDQPGAFDGTKKVRKTMVEKLKAAAEQFEDGSGKNHGSEYCTDPLVNADNFDKIGPDFWASEVPKAKVAAPRTEATAAAETRKSVHRAEAPAASRAAQPAVSNAEEHSEAVKAAAAALSAAAKSRIVEASTPKVERIPCDACGAFVLKGKKFCTMCGASMEKKPEKKLVCANCGEPLEEDKFCNGCGRPVKQAPKPLICVNCGELLDEGDKFCNECGTPVKQEPEPLVCPNCGELLEEGDRFCNECGTKVEAKPKRPTHCPQCGDELEEDDKFCSSCGLAIS